MAVLLLQTRQVADASNTSLVTLLANVNSATNTAANTVKVMANSGTILSNHSLNFVNTAQIAVTITDNGDGNANISFATGGISANAANTVKVMANSAGILAPRSLNFVNTATVNVAVFDNADGNANVSFQTIGQSAADGNTVKVMANSAGILTSKSLNFINTNTTIVSVTDNGDGNANISFAHKVSLTIPLTDLVTNIVAGANVAYVRAPRPFTLTQIRASLLRPSNGGAVNVQVTMNNTNVFTTLLTVDNLSYTSVGSNVTPVIANTTILDDANLKYSIISAGSNALGLIVTLTGTAV